MEKYLDGKKEIIEKQLPDLQKRLMEANMQILKELNRALDDNKISADVKLNISDWIKIGQFSFDRESSTGMKSEDKLELAKKYFENAKMMMDSLKEDRAFVNSYMKNIDEQLEMTKEDIRRIDEEIKNTQDQDKIARLKEEKNEKIAKY